MLLFGKYQKTPYPVNKPILMLCQGLFLVHEFKPLIPIYYIKIA